MSQQETFKPNEDFCPRRKSFVRFAQQSIEVKKALIAENPDYGEIVCRCEKITKAEILNAIHNPLGVNTMYSETEMEKAKAELKSTLDAVAAQLAGYSVKKEVVVGRAGDEILECADQNNTDIIVMPGLTKTPAKK